ncbi:hypothetical protein D3C85_1764980 [compost metagenome]
MIGHQIGGLELAAAVAVHPDEIRVAEGANGGRPVPLQPAPQIAAGEAQEDGGPPSLSALALHRQEDFLGRIGHARAAHSP